MIAERQGGWMLQGRISDGQGRGRDIALVASEQSLEDFFRTF